MAGDSFDYLGNIKLILGITDNGSDNLLNLYISMVRSQILNYCNLSELPPALNYTLCQMVADIYCDNQNKTTKSSVVGNVASISEDGRSVSFTSGAELRTQIEDRVSRTAELNKFKKLYRV